MNFQSDNLNTSGENLNDANLVKFSEGSTLKSFRDFYYSKVVEDNLKSWNVYLDYD